MQNHKPVDLTSGRCGYLKTSIPFKNKLKRGSISGCESNRHPAGSILEDKLVKI